MRPALEYAMTLTAPRFLASALSLAVFAAGACWAQGLPASATTRLQALDADHDGVLSRYEYDSEAALAMMDSDGNGEISAEELQAFLGPQDQGGASAAERIVGSDVDNNGELSDEELRRSLDFRFKWLDKNKDGNVDLAELSTGIGVPMIGRK